MLVAERRQAGDIRAGKAWVVTDEIDKFTEAGILLKSGKLLEADIIITATGFDLNVLGDIEFTVDSKPLVFSETVTYRGMMFTGVPNMAWVFGYFRASWTLRVDLVGDFTCQLLNHMRKKGARKATPALRPEDKDMPLLPWIDPENFNPGYPCAACTCFRNEATSLSGNTPKITGARKTSFRLPTLTTARSYTSERHGARGVLFDLSARASISGCGSLRQ